MPIKQKYKIQLVSVILPTYNESENIVDLVKEINKQIKHKKEIIVVDDNSPDGTSNIVKKFKNKNQKINLKLETRYKNKGLANSIKRGIEISKGDIVVWMDCDFSMPPKIIPKLLQKIEIDADIVVGSRFAKGGGFKRDNSKGQKDSPIAIILSRAMNIFIQLVLGGGFRDYTSGFIAIKKTVFRKVTLRGDYGEYFIDLIYKSKSFGFKILEIPYICIPREKGESKTGQNLNQFLRRGLKYIFLTIQLVIEKRVLHRFS